MSGPHGTPAPLAEEGGCDRADDEDPRGQKVRRAQGTEGILQGSANVGADHLPHADEGGDETQGCPR